MLEEHEQQLKDKVAGIGEVMETIAALEDSQVAMYLLRQCVSVCLFNYLLRTTSYLASRKAAENFDKHLRRSFNKIGSTSVLKDFCSELRLPRRTKKVTQGLGLTSASNIAHAAYLGFLTDSVHRWNQSWKRLEKKDPRAEHFESQEELA